MQNTVRLGRDIPSDPGTALAILFFQCYNDHAEYYDVGSKGTSRIVPCLRAFDPDVIFSENQ